LTEHLLYVTDPLRFQRCATH